MQSHSFKHYPFISITMLFHSKSKQGSKILPMKIASTSTKTTTTTTSKKKMPTMLMRPRGFTCHSTAATAVCMPATAMAPSVILPRKLADHHYHQHQYPTFINNNTNNAKYSRLVAHDSPYSRFVSTSSVSANANKSSIKHHHHYQDQEQQQPKSKLPTSSSHAHQVVVMRVSIHCQGCAGKLKKHLSKMEGVTSYSIDLETKRVTVMGHVSPDGVLESISKVKKAEFWSN